MKPSIPTAALNLTLAALAVVSLGCASANPGRAPEATADAPADAASPGRAATAATAPTAEPVATTAEPAAPETPEPAATPAADATARPREFRVGEREVPLLPEGMTATVVPALVTEAQPVYQPAPRMPGQEGITAFDVPKPANPNPTGRGRGLPVRPVSTPAPITGGPAVDDPTGGPLGIGIGGGPPAPLAPPFVTTFDSTIFDDNGPLSGSFFIPPDPHAAAGVNHVVNVVNTTIRFHTKAGATTFHAGLASFFAPLGPLTATFDPKVIYDQFEDRFVVVTLEQTDTAFGDPADTSRIFVAVSDDGDPNGAWTLLSIPVVITPASCGVAAWADYPGFAVDEDAVYITNNLFGFFSFGAPYCGVRLWVVDKGVVGGFYAGAAATTFVSDPYAGAGIATTTQPAHAFCTPGGGGTCPSPDGTYLVSYSGLSAPPTDFVQIVRIDTPLSATPTYVQQFLAIGDIEPIAAALPSAPQMGSTFPIATNDRRALNAVWRDDDSLWMTATIDPLGTPSADEATAHWWQLDTSGADPTYTSLVQQGSIDGEPAIAAADVHTFFPSIAVNSKNDVAIGFSASAATLFAGSYYTTREAGDPPGFTSPAVPLRLGLDTYERTFDSVGGCSELDSRWGDYSGISVDPTNECFWVYNEHAIARGTPTAGVCGDLPAPADGIEDGRWGTAHGQACICASSKALTTGAWRQISMPCDPGPADTVADVFGDDLSGTYATDWIVYRRDEAIPAYVALTLTDSLAVGEGYWIKSNIAAQTIAMGGTINPPPPATDIPLTGVAAAPPAGCGSSAGQCNKVGHPHNFDVCWADVLVDDGGAISLATADPSNACQTTGVGCIMSRIAHKWTGASYAPFDGVTSGMEGTLVPWDGFFVSANKPGIELRIPAMPGAGPPCGPPAETFGAASPGSASGWYIRLIAESDDGMVDRSSVFGQMPGSARGYDSRDLKELDPFGNDYLTLVFPHPEWGVQAGNYASDYRAAGPGLRGESWDFEVRASAPGQNVLLSWEGGAEQLKRSILVDRTTGKRLRPRPDGSYAFRMRGTSHSFSWQLLGAEQPKPRRSRRGSR